MRTCVMRKRSSKNRARYADLYDFASIAFCTLDKSTRIIDINFAGATLLARARVRLTGQPFAAFLPAAERDGFRLHVARVCERGTALTADIRIGADVTRLFQMASTSMRGIGGEIIGCRTAFTDVTSRKAADDMLRASIKMREHLLSVVSQELRSPLDAVVASVERLLAQGPVDESADARQHLEVIGRASTRMRRLVELSSIDASGLGMNTTPQQAAHLVQLVAEQVAPLAADKQISIDVRVELEDGAVICDKQRVLQVLLNLASNAVKFTAKTGELRFGVALQGDRIAFSVSDNGIGMTKDQLERMFDPYWRAETSKLEGAGIGLSVAKSIVELHSGSIWAVSRPSIGTTVTFTLPLALPKSVVEASLAAVMKPVRPQADRRLTLLVVDDEVEARDGLVELLQRRNFDIVTANDGREALSVLGLRPVDLVLLDLAMPNMDGWHFLAQRPARLVKIPVLLISGGHVDPAGLAQVPGLVGQVPKPISLSTLLAAIGRVTQSMAVID